MSDDDGDAVDYTWVLFNVFLISGLFGILKYYTFFLALPLLYLLCWCCVSVSLSDETKRNGIRGMAFVWKIKRNKKQYSPYEWDVVSNELVKMFRIGFYNSIETRNKDCYVFKEGDELKIDADDYHVLIKILYSIKYQASHDLDDRSGLKDWVRRNAKTDPMGAMALTKISGHTELNSRVRNLELPKNLQLPNVIQKLEGLYRLSWTVDDYLYPSMPSWIGTLKNLQKLHLRGRHLMVALPDEIGQLEHLNELVVSARILGAGPIPPSWGKLTNLKKLELDLKGVPCRLPSVIGNLTNLEELDLKGSAVVLLLSSIGMLEKIRSLVLYEEPIPEELGYLINLQEVEISSHYSLSLPSSIGLLRLDIPDEICSLVSLTDLNINGFQKIPPGIGKLTNLHNLRISCSHVVAMPESMESLRNLRTLDLQSNKQLQSLPNWIYQLTDLETLNLSECIGLKDLPLVVQNLLEHCKGLVDLDLSSCGIRELFPHRSIPLKLERLCLTGNPILCDNTPNENLVHLVMESPLIGWFGDSSSFSPLSMNSNWIFLFRDALGSNRARSRVMLYGQDKSFPIALWTFIFQRASAAFRGDLYDDYRPTQQDAIYRLLMMRGANDVFGNNAYLPESGLARS